MWRKVLLKKLKSYIYNQLDPAKVNIIDLGREIFVQPLSIPEILAEPEITDEDFYRGLPISKGDDLQLHLKFQIKFWK